MNQIANISLKHLKNASKYLKPTRMEYKINGKIKTADLITTHDAVTGLLFNKSRKVFVLVKQFRPLVYVTSLPKSERLGEIDLEKHPISNGITIEACSGIVDKKLSNEQVMVEEIFEECGYKVRPDNLKKILSYRTGPITSSAINHFYYCELDDSMLIKEDRISKNVVDVVEMTIDEVKEHLKRKDYLSSPLLCFGFYWFFKNKLNFHV